MKGYEAKVKRRLREGSRLHRTAEESSASRFKKRLLGKSSWFRGKKSIDEKEQYPAPERSSNGKKVTKPDMRNSTLRTRSVLFVEQTPRGELAILLREQLQKMEQVLGYRIRVVERTGRNIMSSYPQTATWRGLQCGRVECITCNQGGEDLPDCTRASVVYESICVVCNPRAPEKGELKVTKEGAPSLYVGETSRSVQERAVEHFGAAKRKEEDSHMYKHQ